MPGAQEQTDAPLTPLGYQQIGTLTASTGLTVPNNAFQARIQCTGQAVRWRDDGTAPTATVGMQLAVGERMNYAGNLSALRFIQESATAVLNVSYYW